MRQWSAREQGASADMAAVLGVTGSLTRFLMRHYGMNLSVHVQEQFVDRCSDAEALLLECGDGQTPCLRRRVALQHRSVVMIDAESVLPLDGVPAELMQALQQGERPLGDLLIDRGLSLSRSDLSIARIGKDVDASEACWARRSVLKSPSGTRALVVEYFRSEIWRRLKHLKRYQ